MGRHQSFLRTTLTGITERTIMKMKEAGALALITCGAFALDAHAQIEQTSYRTIWVDTVFRAKSPIQLDRERLGVFLAKTPVSAVCPSGATRFPLIFMPDSGRARVAIPPA